MPTKYHQPRTLKVAVQPCELHKLSQQTNINTCSSSSSNFLAATVVLEVEAARLLFLMI